MPIWDDLEQEVIADAKHCTRKFHREFREWKERVESGWEFAHFKDFQDSLVKEDHTDV